MLEERIERIFGDDQSSAFGTGWWSGVTSLFFGLLAAGSVLCLHFPQLLTDPDYRTQYPMTYLRILIQCVIGLGFLLGFVSTVLRRKKMLGLTGMLLALLATLFGGASVPINETPHAGPALGLDWLMLDSLMMAMIYVPLERLFPQYPQQSAFKKNWTLDVKYWLSTHLPVQLLSFLWILPGMLSARWLALPKVETFVGGLPWWVQFPLAVFVADLSQYFIHRTFHAVPWLWPFHAIHHSSKELDWIAGSRSHFVDVVVGRGFILLPLIYFGFSQPIIFAYLVFVTLHATLQHSNFAPSIAWLDHVIVMPRHHHWHHAGEEEAIDKDFAIHFPWIDRFFGTYYYPDRWPKSYGLIHSELPAKFWAQFFAPFKGKLPPKDPTH